MPAGNMTNEVVSKDALRVWTAEGKEFEGAVVVDMAVGATRFISFEVPVEATGTVIALQTRFFKSDYAKVDLEILWDTASITGGANIPIFNSYRDLNIASVVQYKDNVTVDETGSILREQDFIGGSIGQGNQSNSSGQIDPTTGSRLYAAGEHFVVKLTNNSGEVNKVKLGYKWAELPEVDGQVVL